MDIAATPNACIFAQTATTTRKNFQLILKKIFLNAGCVTGREEMCIESYADVERIHKKMSGKACLAQ